MLFDRVMLTSGAYCIKLLPEKNSGYFTGVFFYVKVNGRIMLTGVSDFTRVFSLVKDLCNRPLKVYV